MKLHADLTPGTYRISAYGPGYVTINDERVAGSLIVTPNKLIADWPPQAFVELESTHLLAVLALEPEIVVLGTGVQQRFPDGPLLEPILTRGIGVEVMDTAAACRTYNILMSEGRQVAAVLLPVSA